MSREMAESLTMLSSVAEKVLLERASRGDAEALEALLVAYRPKIIAIARQFTIPGLDFDDKVSECSVAFVRAVRAWSPTRGAAFKNFAKLLMMNVLTERYRSANCQKEGPLSRRVSIDDLVDRHDPDSTISDTLAGPSDVFQEVASGDSFAILKRFVASRVLTIACENSAAGIESRALLCLFAREMFEGDYLAFHTYEQHVHSGFGQISLDLFDQVPPALSANLVASVEAAFALSASSVLDMLAEGWTAAEIVDRLGSKEWLTAFLRLLPKVLSVGFVTGSEDDGRS